MEIKNFGTLKLTLSIAISYTLAFTTIGFSYFSLKKHDYVRYVMFIEKCFTLSKYIVTRFEWKGFSMCLDGN